VGRTRNADWQIPSSAIYNILDGFERSVFAGFGCEATVLLAADGELFFFRLWK